MSKLVKRIKKTLPEIRNAIVIGTGFGQLEQLLRIFNSVFVFMNADQRLKAKNVIYRENLEGIHLLPEITVVFIDVYYKESLDKFENVMVTLKPIFFIEGDEVIGREYTKKFYQTGYRAVEQQGLFHVWKKTQ